MNKFSSIVTEDRINLGQLPKYIYTDDRSHTPLLVECLARHLSCAKLERPRIKIKLYPSFNTYRKVIYLIVEDPLLARTGELINKKSWKVRSYLYTTFENNENIEMVE